MEKAELFHFLIEMELQTLAEVLEELEVSIILAVELEEVVLYI